MKFSIFHLLIVHSIILGQFVRAQQTLPSGCLNAFRIAALHWHNMYRQMHGVPDLIEDSNLNTQAQNWANSLAATSQTNQVPANPDANPVLGLQIAQNSWQNQVGGSGIANSDECTFYGSTSVTSLYSEINLYDYKNPGFSTATGHFTQMVWKSSTSLGMGWSWYRIRDPNQAGAFLNRYIAIYYYSPAGNSGFGCPFTNSACNFPTNVLPVIIEGTHMMPTVTPITSAPSSSSSPSPSSSSSSPSSPSSPSSSSSSPSSSSSSLTSPSPSTSSTCQNTPGFDYACNYFVSAGFGYCQNQLAFLGSQPFVTTCKKSCGFCTTSG